MHRNLGLRIITVVAAIAMVAACSKKPPQTSTTAGTGGGYGTPSGAAPAGGGEAPRGGVTPGTQEDLVANVGDRVFFDTNGYSLSPEAQATLQRQAQWLKTYGNVHVTIEGHCDERGTREYNLALGERRANSARNFLVSLGVQPNRITTISYGKERPVATCSDESCWSQNRRAVTVVQ